jgi:hypothetical protein
MILAMGFLPKTGCCKGSTIDSAPVAEHTGESNGTEDSHLLRTVGWISAAFGAVALGVLVGRELRLRYKFNRQTPYDLYAHSGDELPDVDFGVGI